MARCSAVSGVGRFGLAVLAMDLLAVVWPDRTGAAIAKTIVTIRTRMRRNSIKQGVKLRHKNKVAVFLEKVAAAEPLATVKSSAIEGVFADSAATSRNVALHYSTLRR